MKNNEENELPIVAIRVLIIFLFLLIGYLVYKNVYLKQSKSESNSNTSEKKSEEYNKEKKETKIEIKEETKEEKPVDKDNIDKENTKIGEEKITSTDLKNELVKKLEIMYSFYGHSRFLVEEVNLESISSDNKMRIVTSSIMNTSSSKIVANEKYDEIVNLFNYSKQEIDTLIDENGYVFSVITLNDVKNRYYELYGNELTNINDIPGKCLNWKYSKISETYIGEGLCDSSWDNIFVYNNNYTMKNNEAYIYVSVGEYDEYTNMLYSYALGPREDYDSTKEYKKCEYNDVQNILEENYKDFSEYKVTFKKNNNGDYYFYSVEEVNK